METGSQNVTEIFVLQLQNNECQTEINVIVFFFEHLTNENHHSQPRNPYEQKIFHNCLNSKSIQIVKQVVD